MSIENEYEQRFRFTTEHLGDFWIETTLIYGVSGQAYPETQTEQGCSEDIDILRAEVGEIYRVDKLTTEVDQQVEVTLYRAIKSEFLKDEDTWRGGDIVNNILESIDEQLSTRDY